jgi:hypothetical protein
MLVRFIGSAEADIAYETWGANCGPGAIAAIMNLSLDKVRPLMGDFERKHYTNPTLMWEVLNRIGRPWRKIGRAWPEFGLARIQWEGPWTAPGAHPKAAYRHTHWVASWKHAERGHGIFDINMTGNGSGWAKIEDWERDLVPLIVQHIPRANGKWHVTHGVEIKP